MIIDIRDSKRYREGHIEHAVNIPFALLFSNPSNYLKTDHTYYLYCDTGSNSGMLVSYLNRLGFHCVNLEGGYAKHLFK